MLLTKADFIILLSEVLVMFKSVDELNNFSFADCVITGLKTAEDGLVIDAEALIVKANNSQNSNFTESYAGPSVIKFLGGSISDIVKVGFKYYDADGKLLREVADEPVNKAMWGALIKSFPGNYLPEIELSEGVYTVEIEMSEEDGTQGNSYLLSIPASGVTVSWEHYMNRVQK